MFSLVTYEFCICIFYDTVFKENKSVKNFFVTKEKLTNHHVKNSIHSRQCLIKRIIYLYFQVICNIRILRSSHHELKTDNLNLTSTTGCQTKITSNNVSQCTRLFPAPADLSTRGSEATGLELLTSDRCSQLTKQ